MTRKKFDTRIVNERSVKVKNYSVKGFKCLLGSGDTNVSRKLVNCSKIDFSGSSISGLRGHSRGKSLGKILRYDYEFANNKFS